MTSGNVSLDDAVAQVAEHLDQADALTLLSIAVDLVRSGVVDPQEECDWVVPVREDLACSDRAAGAGSIVAIRSSSGLVPALVVALAGRAVLAVLDDGDVTCDEVETTEPVDASEVWVEHGDRRYLGLELVMASSDGPWRRVLYVDRDLQDQVTLDWHDRLIGWFVEVPQDIAGDVVRRCPTCGSYLDDDVACSNCAHAVRASPTDYGMRVAASGAASATTGGWHADPWGRHELRFHDGQNWTAHVSDRGVAGVDGGSDPARSAAPALLWQSQTASGSSPQDPAPAAAPAAAATAAGPAADAPVAPHGPAASGPGDVLAQLERLAALRASGAVTDEEFEVLKAAVLAQA